MVSDTAVLLDVGVKVDANRPDNNEPGLTGLSSHEGGLTNPSLWYDPHDLDEPRSRAGTIVRHPGPVAVLPTLDSRCG